MAGEPLDQVDLDERIAVAKRAHPAQGFERQYRRHEAQVERPLPALPDPRDLGQIALCVPEQRLGAITQDGAGGSQGHRARGAIEQPGAE